MVDLIVTELKDWSALIGGKFICKKNPLQDLPSSVNAVISTNAQCNERA